ncbi:MAG: hydantoinase/oxoprolinase family protein [Alphaproteobacteria bacterium]|nr:hydantoinase/oxoprolinase family protein [Alphaproteobacteria bacterium]
MRLIGVDVGGTFTDGVLYDTGTAELRRAKASSTPGEPWRGVLAVIDQLGVDMGNVDRFVHGVTIGTNAILERKGAAVWLITTAGFRDVLEIARTNRSKLYDIKALKPAPLVPRERVIEVDERLFADGSVCRPLRKEDVETVAAVLGKAGADAVAVCLLHSYTDARHERIVADALDRALPGCFRSLSSDVLPEMREYERAATTVLNSYIGPLTRNYLGALEEQLAGRGYRRPVFIMNSAGGVETARRAARFPVHTVLSGPAGGVAAGLHLGAALGYRNLITYDMGGTSTDVCLIRDGIVPVTGEQFIAEQPNRTPQIEINSVGAGGGSLAWIDDGDILRVGPHSAGAHPGPACYGRGGTAPTVTDANVMLGRLSAGLRLAGSVALDGRLADAAVASLASRLPGLTPDEAAEGIVRIAVARMVTAIKEISIGRGHDPRDFVLVAYGGAGPMHAAAIAAELEIATVVVPPGPGNFSAFGALISDLRHDHVRTRLLRLAEARLDAIEAGFAAMEEAARKDLLDEGVAAERIVFRRGLGMRYLGQSWDLPVDLPAGLGSIAAIEELFHARHLERFGYRGRNPVEIVSFRLAAIGRVDQPAAVANGAAPAAAAPAHRPVRFDGRTVRASVHERERLMPGQRIAGPAIIEEMGAVTVVPPGWSCRQGSSGELLIERNRT